MSSITMAEATIPVITTNIISGVIVTPLLVTRRLTGAAAGRGRTGQGGGRRGLAQHGDQGVAVLGEGGGKFGGQGPGRGFDPQPPVPAEQPDLVPVQRVK